jgi:xanthine/CO dehydrogenase XdhC/CoxF family maturation factor
LIEAMAVAMARGVPTAVTLTGATGDLDLLVEPILPPIALWIFGAGEHTRPLARLAKEMGWWLGVVDHRPALATPERFPGADRIVVGHPPESLLGLPLDPRSAALVVGHIYEMDRILVEALLQARLGYLGLQGNRTRSARILREIEADGLILSQAQQEMLHWPAGLDLGGETPEAIALSMVAEVQAVLAGHLGGSLKHQTGSIHGQIAPLLPHQPQASCSSNG